MESCPLENRKCVPCSGGTQPLKGDQLTSYARQAPEWTVAEEHHLTRTFRFKNFADALGFVNKVGALAEEQNHHPDIYLAWGQATISIWTHKINGLTESDFILAAKIDAIG
jgi:4a-hydroxytetrahydrobiopterin dehydratase